MLSYSRKQLKFIFVLAQDVFKNTGSSTLEVTGLRASINIEKAGGAQFSTLEGQIFGISQEDMNDITTLFWSKNNLNKNTIEVYAVDDSGAYTSLVFAGSITQAWAYYQQMPDVYLYINAMNIFYNLQKPWPPTSYKGSIDVATAIQKIATGLGYNFENNGVNSKLNNLYVADTGIKQIQEIAIAANIDVYFDDNTVAICPAGQARKGYDVDISESTGMIGYPTFDGLGVDIEVLFNPSIVWGGKINVTSTLQRANGEWTLTSLNHILQSQMPGGAFMSQLRGTLKNVAINK